MDYNQQIEALRMDAPERVGIERMHRVAAAVDNVLQATADAAVMEAERIVAAEAERVRAEQANAQAVRAAAESIVAGEAAVVSGEQDGAEARTEESASDATEKSQEALRIEAQQKIEALFDANPFYGGQN